MTTPAEAESGLTCDQAPTFHVRRLMTVLQRLQDAGLTLNERKCAFSQSQVKFLGQMIDQQGVRPDPDKVSAILNMRTRTCAGDIC